MTMANGKTIALIAVETGITMMITITITTTRSIRSEMTTKLIAMTII